MIQLIVRLVFAHERVDEAVIALRTVLLPAQLDRSCSFAQIEQRAGDARLITYVEEWDDESALRAQLASPRFRRLLELLESADEPPFIEFRSIAETHGLEYIAKAWESKAATN